MDFRIAVVGLEEAPTVLRLMQLAFEEYRGKLDPPSGALSETLDDVRGAIGGGGAFLAFADGKAVGSARFQVFSDHIYGQRIAVLPAYRGRGIAAALSHAIEASARARNVTQVRVKVRGSLPSNFRVYEKLGYRMLGTSPYPNGRDTEITLAKDLPGGHP